MLIRVDTGGTFTDAWAKDQHGHESRCKVLSSSHLRLEVLSQDGSTIRIKTDSLPPQANLSGFTLNTSKGEITVLDHQGKSLSLSTNPPALSVAELHTHEEAPVLAVRLLTATPVGKAFPQIDLRVATTRGTNALLEHTGAPLLLITNEGLEDLHLIRDQRRDELFSIQQPERKPLVDQVIGTSARLDANGCETIPLDLTSLGKRALDAKAQGLRVAAIALLHSDLNPAHEITIEEMLHDLGFDYITRSSAVAPFIKLLPRMETAMANAWLSPIMEQFISRVTAPLDGNKPLLMTSAGGLHTTENYQPKDSLLSGPAGGVVGAKAVAEAAGYSNILTFDMGGTSTDVARIAGPPEFRYEQEIGPAWVMAPAMKIETVAAGGSSICQWRQGGLEVGPESAGASPGPACYGRGGPLTLTDVNLLLGHMDPNKAGIPLSVEAAQQALATLKQQITTSGATAPSDQELLQGLRDIAIERMVEAIRTVSIREGYLPTEHALLAFGGAGPQHACAIAERLEMDTVIVPGDCGLLSAFGLHCAEQEALVAKQILKPLDELPAEEINALVNQSQQEACDQLRSLGTRSPSSATALKRPDTAPRPDRTLLELRLTGQSTTLEIPFSSPETIAEEFANRYHALYGYHYDAAQHIELVSLRAIAVIPSDALPDETIPPNTEVTGPHLLQDSFSTCVIPLGWKGSRGDQRTLILKKTKTEAVAETKSTDPIVEAELYRNRFESIVTDMGEILRRTALSTNVKERLDFSCALLDAQGHLIMNAPHIPVHLGALGVCVRRVAQYFDNDLADGDAIIVNHPAFGGSHLPDVTIITPVFYQGEIHAWVANRAHHAEIGGMAPGSMPANARHLSEEGVVIPPTKLVIAGDEQFSSIADLLVSADFPSRKINDNLADLRAQLASNYHGVTQLKAILKESPTKVATYFDALTSRSASLMQQKIKQAGEFSLQGSATMDCGATIQLSIQSDASRLTLDFTGTDPVLANNLNATEAIVRSVVLYCMRLWVNEPLPLNEGLLDSIDITLPRCFLNPDFESHPHGGPAVVGGNVEVSQQLTDLILYTLGIQAQSQGTMNNLLFGNDKFGYYETIAGGAGASALGHGTSAKQVHMTNTSMTDVELMERRYPVRVDQFAIRQNSGGTGTHRGGDGITRQLTFLEPVTLSLLTNRRTIGAQGLNTNSSAAPGTQQLTHPDGSTESLPDRTTINLSPNTTLTLNTPGGGGWSEAIG